MNPKTAFETFLNQQNDEAWSAALATLVRSIHEVDRNATQIWFAFYPLTLFSALDAAEDIERLLGQVRQYFLLPTYAPREDADR